MPRGVGTGKKSARPNEPIAKSGRSRSVNERTEDTTAQTASTAAGGKSAASRKTSGARKSAAGSSKTAGAGTSATPTSGGRATSRAPRTAPERADVMTEEWGTGGEGDTGGLPMEEEDETH